MGLILYIYIIIATVTGTVSNIKHQSGQVLHELDGLLAGPIPGPGHV